MNIAKCPLCGNEPKIKHWSLVGGDVSIHCCGVTIDGGEKQWSQFAAAMELAKVMIRIRKIYRMPLVDIEGQLNDAVEAENEAKERVLEVFK